MSALILRRELFRKKKFNLLKRNYKLKIVKVSAFIFDGIVKCQLLCRKEKV